MQRTARLLLPFLCLSLGVTGCSQPKPAPATRPLPEPLLITRTPPPAPPRPAPPAPLIARTRVQGPEFGWAPPGGIRRGLWKSIVVHHSASDKATPQSMNAYHLQRGWENGLGYHFVIGNGVNYPDGKIFVGPRWKRQQVGAHCKTGAGRFFGIARQSGFFNEHGIGICLIGDFEKRRPTPRQEEALQRLIAFLCNEADIDPSAVHGHGDVTGKTKCPGRYLDVASIRRSVKQISASSN